MAKVKVAFECSDCGAMFQQWQGQCRECGQWNTITESRVQKAPASGPRRGYASEVPKLTRLDAVDCERAHRISSGLAELDHVLGGGIVSDSVVLLGGDPGIGKSTILLQMLSHLARAHTVLYVTGEESLSQVAVRAQRLGLPTAGVHLLADTEVGQVIAQLQKLQPTVVVIDSIQTMYCEQLSAAPGSVSQVRDSAAQLIRFAKSRGIALFIAGHVTKEGAIAGPRVLEHMVDAVLYFEGQASGRFRIVRAVKNRFGAVNEMAIFAMTETGLRQVSNPSAIFLSRGCEPVAGSIVMASWEGTRPLLVEIQALVDQSHLGNPRRVTVGLEQNRLAMLLAILHRHCQVVTADQDVFVNAVGGIRIIETGTDLAVVLAVLSSLKQKPLPADMIVFAELGLSGELRPVPNGEARLKEAAKHGFKQAIVASANAPKKAIKGMQVISAQTLAGVLAQDLL